MPQLPNQTPGQSISNQLPESQPTPQPAKHFPRPLILGLLLIILALSATVAYLLFTQSQKDKVDSINSYEECVAANNGQVNLMYPPTCTTPDGRTFTDPSAKAVVMPEQPNQSQIEDTTAEWNTYTNTAYNYKISFPKDWGTQTQAPGAKAGAHQQSNMIDIQPTNNMQPYPVNIITIQSFGLAPSEYNQSESVNINGINASKVVYPPKEDKSFYSESYLLPSSDSKYVEILIRDNSERSNKELFEQILSTFEFVDEQADTDMGVWQTYTNNFFSFDIPKDWDLKDLTSLDKSISIDLNPEGVGLTCTEVVNQSTINIDGQNFEQTTYQPVISENCDLDANNFIAVIVMPIEGYPYYSFSFSYDRASSLESERLLGKILSTLKFLD